MMRNEMRTIFPDSEDALYALDMTWWYFFSKYIDYFDSVFFLLRKKFSHLSTLHVVHHGIMPLTAWSGVKWVGGGHTTFVGRLGHSHWSRTVEAVL